MESHQRVEREAYTIAEAAQAMALSTKTIRRLIDRGLLKRVPGIRVVRISRRALERFLNHT
jgi:excisionase family DNA binding protein